MRTAAPTLVWAQSRASQNAQADIRTLREKLADAGELRWAVERRIALIEMFQRRN